MVDLRTIEVPTEVLNLIPKQTAIDLSVLPLHVETDGVVIAMTEETVSAGTSGLDVSSGQEGKARDCS